jgi:tetratricopeptide (TPR) repeat protein
VFCKLRGFLKAILPVAVLLSLGCRRAQLAQGYATPRYAVLRFENLSGDPSLDWVGRALNESLPDSLDGAMDGPVLPASALSRTSAALGARPAAAPGISGARSAAIAAGANRAITGYIDRSAGVIRIVATIRDLATGRTLRSTTASGSSPYETIQGLARQLSPRAKPPISKNPEALEAYSEALEMPAGEVLSHLQRATSLDPAFGEAWTALVNYETARGDRAAAEAVITEAGRNNLGALDRARLELQAANLEGDRGLIVDATKKIVSLTPGDAALARSLAEMETVAGRFKESAADWARIASEFPEDPLVWNSLGYARSYAGDYAGALDALQHYDRLRPSDANPQDSIGDLNYAFGKFKEAADHYANAYKRQPGFELSGDLFKAAMSKFRAGDKTGADALFAQYKAERAKASKDIADLLAADWLYRTGRRTEGAAGMRQVAAGTQLPQARADAFAQLTVWDLIAGDRVQAASDAMSIGNAGSPSLFLAKFTALPSAMPADWMTRAQTMVPGNAAALRPLAVGYALVLDKKREAALSVWEQIVKTSPATDFFAQAVYSQLKGERFGRYLLPEAGSLNPFLGIVEQ